MDFPSRIYDFINAGAIIVNLIVSILYTFAEIRQLMGVWLLLIERITVIFFAVDYFLRVITAGELYDELTERHAVKKYVFSFTGLVDLLSFLPYFLPVFIPAGTVAFRMVRIVRIFRLFRINAYYDSLNVITEVIAGKMLGIIITFLGVGMVAIPTGIISAGFVDQYSNIKKRVEFGYEADMHFIKIKIKENDAWARKRIAELNLPQGVIIAIVKRKEQAIIPRGDLVLQAKDSIVLGAEPFSEHEKINLKEIVLKEQNPWTGLRIRDLDISRHSVIVLVKRGNKALIPNGNMILTVGDRVFVYTQQHLFDANEIEI